MKVSENNTEGIKDDIQRNETIIEKIIIWDAVNSYEVCVINIPEKEERENEKAVMLLINDWKFSEIDQKHQNSNRKNSMFSKQNKYKENYTWAHHSQTAKNQIQREILKIIQT